MLHLLSPQLGSPTFFGGGFLFKLLGLGARAPSDLCGAPVRRREIERVVPNLR